MADNTITNVVLAHHLVKEAEGTIGQYKAVIAGTANNQVLIAGAAARCIGISTVSATVGQDINIVSLGGAEAMLGGTVSAVLTALKSDANGDLVAATDGTDIVVAWSLDTGVDNDIIPVLVNQGTK